MKPKKVVNWVTFWPSFDFLGNRPGLKLSIIFEKSLPPGNYCAFEKIHFFALHPVVAKIKVIVTVCV